MKSVDFVARFESHVEKIPFDTCWYWTGALNHGGYGQVHLGRGKNRVAHRVAYELYRGSIPAGLVLDHLCRVPSCVNPDHLEPVPQRVNGLRGLSKSAVRFNQTHCINGHPLIPENVRLHKTRFGKLGRFCVECGRNYAREWYRRKNPNWDREHWKPNQRKARYDHSLNREPGYYGRADLPNIAPAEDFDVPA